MTKIILAQELLGQGLSQIDVSERSGISRLTQWVEEWLQYYHYERPHLALGMRPPLLK